VLRLGLACAGLLMLTGASSGAPPSNDGSRSAQLIAEVNALRAANGLPAYVTDPILMSVAAKQNDWRVSTGATTHTGPDGSSPKQRAAAAGYGRGATFFLSENIADGTDLTPAQAVQWWTGDAPHLNTMLGPNYVNVGAAAGESGGIWRYTLMAGYVAGGSYQPGQAPSPQPQPTQVARAAPVLKATELPDGSVVHTVGPGQTLWTIAAVYGVDLETLMSLNGLSSGSLLHEGDKIIVQPSWTPAASPSPTSAPSTTPRSPATPPEYTAPPPSSTPTPTPVPGPNLGDLIGGLRPVNLILIGLGALLMLAGAVAAFRD
jgi:LysM repeat protein